MCMMMCSFVDVLCYVCVCMIVRWCVIVCVFMFCGECVLVFIYVCVLVRYCMHVLLRARIIMLVC